MTSSKMGLDQKVESIYGRFTKRSNPNKRKKEKAIKDGIGRGFVSTERLNT